VNDQKLISGGGRTTPFWKPLSLDELGRQQGVSAVNDLDELLNHIITERNERRALHHRHDGTE
jgi:hypothetical protein